MDKKTIVLTALFCLTAVFTGCGYTDLIEAGTAIADENSSEKDRAPVQISICCGEYDIHLSYNVIPNEADTSNTEISDAMMSVTVNNDIVSECRLINPALSAAPGNSYFPSDLSIKLDVIGFSDWSIAIVRIPIRKDTEIMYYASFFYCSDSIIQTVYPKDKEGRFFPVLSDQTIFETDREIDSFSFADNDGEKYYLIR